MFYTGISDEAGRPLETQIRAHKALGWDHVELRMVGEHSFSIMPDDLFEQAVELLDAAGMKVSCFASGIANWARKISCDPQKDYDDLAIAMPRMRRLGTPFIRIMSYPNDPDAPVPETEWRRESIARVKRLARMAEDGGVTLVHENCSGWGGESAENTLALLNEVNSPALKLVWDTGNPVSYGQDPWSYFKAVRDAVVYVHIKDAKPVESGTKYTWCGEGAGYVRETVADLLAGGYEGGFSIEPHLGSVIHTGERAATDQELYDAYVEYGRRLVALVDEVRPG
jgi:sugar phosphate isomerase/epimerase